MGSGGASRGSLSAPRCSLRAPMELRAGRRRFRDRGVFSRRGSAPPGKIQNQKIRMRNSKSKIQNPKSTVQNIVSSQIQKTKAARSARAVEETSRITRARRQFLINQRITRRAPMELRTASFRFRNARYEFRRSFAWLVASSEMLVASSDEASRGSLLAPRCSLRAPTKLHKGRLRLRSACCEFRWGFALFAVGSENARHELRWSFTWLAIGSADQERPESTKAARIMYHGDGGAGQRSLSRLLGRSSEEASPGSSSAPKCSLRAPKRFRTASLRLRDACFEFRRNFIWLVAGSEMFVTSSDGASHGSLLAPKCSMRAPTKLREDCFRYRNACYELRRCELRRSFKWLAVGSKTLVTSSSGASHGSASSPRCSL